MPAPDPGYFLDLMFQRGASDLLLSAGAPASMRVDGSLTAVGPVLSADTVEKLVRALVPKSRHSELEGIREVDFSLRWHDRGHIRANAFLQRGTRALTLRMLPFDIPTMEGLGIPLAARDLAKREQGLILVTGPTGSGKSTTIASMVEWINNNRRCHIVTIEDPIEYHFDNHDAVVTQREVGLDTPSFASGLRAALRQDPDVIVIGEMRDLETIQTAVTVAETGHLVFATLHANDSAQAIHRIVDVFPADQQQQIRVQLSQSLSAVMHQRLLPKADGGRVAAFELLIATSAVRQLIRNSELQQVRNVISTNTRMGMLTLEGSLNQLLKEGLIEREEAVRMAAFPQEIAHVAEHRRRPAESSARLSAPSFVRRS